MSRHVGEDILGPAREVDERSRPGRAIDDVAGRSADAAAAREDVIAKLPVGAVLIGYHRPDALSSGVDRCERAMPQHGPKECRISDTWRCSRFVDPVVEALLMHAYSSGSLPIS